MRAPPTGLAPISWTPGLCCLLVGCVLAFEGDRAEITERRVPSLPVVEDLHVLEDCRACLCAGRPVATRDEFPFQCREEALGDGVVPAVAASAHAADDAVRRQELAVVAA